ncbi:hypothetical protein Tco_1363109 [Tanacetum coccineum]
MTTLKFANTHNMVAFLSKPEESDGFGQTVDFLNAHPIKYALIVNPTIYTSCIEQFWSTVKTKTVNGEVQLHALVDGTKIIVTESTIRRDLQLEDVEGIDCLPNSTIFEQLALMRYEKISQKLTFYKPFFSPQWKFLIHTILKCLSPKTTAWNEFSSTMAYAIIYLATNQKINFSKFIFEGMIRNLDNVSGKFLMYPRFIQVFLDQQLEERPTHKRIYNAPSHTKKIFGNMRRVPQPSDPSDNIADKVVHKELDNVANEAVYKELDDSLVRAATTASSLEAEQDSGNITKTQYKATLNELSSPGTSLGSGPRCQETMGDTIAQTRFENVSTQSYDPLLVRGNILQSGEVSLKLNELMELYTSLQTRVLDLEKTNTSQANKIASLKRRVQKLEKRNRSRTHKLKRLYKVGLTAKVESSEESLDALNDEEINVAEQDVVEEVATTTTATYNVNEVTLAQTLMEIKSTKPNVKGIFIQEPEPEKPMKKKDQISFDKETTKRLQAEFDEEEKIAKAKEEKIDEANIA